MDAPSREGEADRAAVFGAGGSQRTPRSRDQEDAGEQAADAGERKWRETLTQEQDPDQHRQQRRAPSRERVDQRQGAALVGRGEADEVDGLEHARQEREPDRLGRHRWRPIREPRPDPDRQEDRGPDRLEPDRRPERVAGRLEQDVPARVQDGRHEDQGDRERWHGLSVPSGGAREGPP